MFEVQTNRLLLREWREYDWTVIFTMSCEPQITRYQSWLRLENEAHAQRWVRNAIHHNQVVPRRAYSMALVERPSEVVVGWLGWGLAEESDRIVSFGYALRPAFWRHGYMTEAVRAMLDWVFTTLDVDGARAYCAESNLASARVLEKAGLQLLKVVAEVDQYTDTTEHYRHYAISRETWQLAQTRDCSASCRFV